jgi:hypothetical protein
MEKHYKNGLLATLLVFSSLFAGAQCEILNRISSDGSMFYYIEPFNVYFTEAKSLKAGIVTDRENYFVELHPIPFPAKPAGNKLKDDLTLKLANGEVLKLDHYDTRYARNDSVMKILFLVKEDDFPKLLENEIAEFNVSMGAEEGVRSYVLKLHKGKLKEQLNCLLNDAEERKKK